LGTALELAISGTSPANIAIPAMGGVHAVIGIGEGLITIGALAFLYTSRPDLIKVGTAPIKGGALVWVAGLLLALLLAVASPFASKHPDGLMWVASQYGFINNEQNPLYRIIPGYLFPGITNETMATIVSALLGTLIVFGVTLGVAFSRRRKQNQDSEKNNLPAE
jgi:cobalt/nickel transport system permease protein